MRRLFTLCIFLMCAQVPLVQAQSLLSHYLAANNALQQSDFQSADQRFAQALELDPNAAEILSNAVLPALITDDFERALAYSKRLDALDLQGALADMVLITDAVNRDDYEFAADVLSRSEDEFPPILYGLLSGWVALGQGSINAALGHLDAMEEPLTAQLFAQFHKSLVLAAVGDFEGADEILTGDERGNLRLTEGSILAHVQILSELGERDRALVLHDSLRSDMDAAEWSQSRRRILAGVLPYDYITVAKDGVAETFQSLATVLENLQNEHLNLALAKLAETIRPSEELALFSAERLADLGQYELALREYDKIEVGNYAFLNAEFGRADVLVDAGQPLAAIEVLRALERDMPEVSRLPIAMGDIYRMDGQCENALNAYDRAIEMIDTFAPRHWFVFHARGTCFYELDQWPNAEEAFRQALELSPNRATVLNYLGYSLVERGEKLEEAQDMIRKAADLRPDSGAIADSLGWVYYRLGKFEEAVAPMEKAIALIPTDPVVNDHLGDVYWMVGRQREAEFQWRRALSFDPSESDADRIRAKLERGLEAILNEEQAQLGQGNRAN